MDGPDPETFGPLATIPADSLVLLATNIAKRCLDLQSLHGKLIARISGSYNITHVIQLEEFKIVIRVPATGWGSRMTKTAADAIRSHAATLRLIRKKDKDIPVPEVYDIDTTCKNEIQAPYLCLSFIPGKPVSKVWFDHPCPFLREEFRKRILKSLSQVMVKFSCLVFDKIGSIMEDESGSTIIGPTFEWLGEEDGKLQVGCSGPFDSTSAFLQQHRKASSDKNEWDRAEAKVLNVLMACYSSFNALPPSFVLCPPDFDSQNVLVDDDGTVTGLIDWDLAQTVPRFIGYARYPGWITRDWDPFFYGWPHMAEFEDSPDALDVYRQYYNIELGKALQWKGDWQFTEKSHVYEAVWIAALNDTNRLEICRKFIQEAKKAIDATNSQGPQEAQTSGKVREAKGVPEFEKAREAKEAKEVNESLDALYDIGAGYYGETEWASLQEGIRRMIC